jgi:hypothetical protein
MNGKQYNFIVYYMEMASTLIEQILSVYYVLDGFKGLIP